MTHSFAYQYNTPRLAPRKSIMTTLIALNTRDAIVMGCDSLGTVTKRLVDPFDLVDYFDTNGDLNIKVDEQGQPILSDFSKIYNKSQHVPYDNMAYVDKLFALEPLEMAVMSAGEVAIGNRTIKNLLGEFKKTDSFEKSTEGTSYTLKSIGRKLLRFMWGYYLQMYPDERRRPELELMLGGYDKRKPTPGIVRIYVNENKIEEPDYDFGVFLGAQKKEIQRIVFGTDYENKLRLIERVDDLLKRYHSLLNQQLVDSGIQIQLKQPGEFGNELYIFNDWDLEGIEARWQAFSEQNAIECVDFLVNIMIKSQQFCSQMPTVGGAVQLAVIKKSSGCTFISRREWRHGDHAVPIKE